MQYRFLKKILMVYSDKEEFKSYGDDFHTFMNDKLMIEILITPQ